MQLPLYYHACPVLSIGRTPCFYLLSNAALYAVLDISSLWFIIRVMVGRDAKGRMVAGHPFIPAKPGHKNGRPKAYVTKVKDALLLAEEAMPEIIAIMIEKAKAGDVRAGEYLCDRIYGKPNQPLSNKDGSKLQSFIFSLPAGMIPSSGGLFATQQGETSGMDERVPQQN